MLRQPVTAIAEALSALCKIDAVGDGFRRCAALADRRLVENA